MNDILNFPEEIISKMLDYQELQGNLRNINIFKNSKLTAQFNGGFDWNRTPEDYGFWHNVISNEYFNIFFERYPKSLAENTLPRVMMTWLNVDPPRPRVVFAIKKGYYYTWGNAMNFEDAEETVTVSKFNHAKELFE